MKPKLSCKIAVSLLPCLLFACSESISRLATDMFIPYASEHEELERSGSDAIGLILDVVQTGLSVNGSPELELNMQFELPDGRLFQGHTKLICPLIDLYRYRPGNELPIRYNPQDPARFTVRGSRFRMPSI